MITRVGRFEGLSAEAAAESQRNLQERFMPALRAQAGFILGLWLEGEDGKLLSITVWESTEAMVAGAQQANATPLLPGQDPKKIPSPNLVEYFKVSAYAERLLGDVADGPEARPGS